MPIMEISKDIAMVIRSSELSWAIPLLVGSLLTIFISKIDTKLNDKSEERKILKTLKYEIFENYIAIKEILSEHKEYKEVSKQLLTYEEFCPLPKFQINKPEFKTNVYEKARELGIIANLNSKDKEEIFIIYNKLNEIIINCKNNTQELIEKAEKLHDIIKESGILKRNLSK